MKEHSWTKTLIGMATGATLLAAWTQRSRLARLAPRRGVHISETADAYMRAQHRVLVLGAGFAGLKTARALAERLSPESGSSILVIDRDNSLLFTPLLWTVADGRAAPNNVVVPIRKFQRGRRFHVLQAEVRGIDLERRVALTSAGERPYDTLVIAVGSVTAVPDLPGLREHALIFAMPANAVELRNRLIDAVEAAHNALDPQERREWLTFVVSGGGDTGVELAAVISSYLHGGLFKEYPWLAQMEVRIVVVGRAAQLLPMNDPQTSEAVRRVLESEGIEVRTGVSVEGATAHEVQTSSGNIPTRSIFWAAGISAPEVIRRLPLRHAGNGALMVDDYLRIPDHPEVYVIGDCAWAFDGMTHAPLPPTAQAAEYMGIYVAQSIADRLAGRETPPLHFAPRGHLALLGRRTGVARIGRFMLTGLPAWLLWHAYYLSHIPSWRNRVRLAIDWLLSATNGRETSELRLKPDDVNATADRGDHRDDRTLETDRLRPTPA